MQISGTIIPVIVSMIFCRAVLSAGRGKENEFDSALQKNIALFDSAYNAWDEKLFTATCDRFRNMERRFPRNHLPPYWRSVVQFHLVSYTLFGLPEHYNRKAAKKYIDKALASLDAALNIRPGDGESLALLGTLTGMKIFLNPLQAPLLGPKVTFAIKEAIAADSTNPRVFYLVGVSYYFTPALLGGGADKGLRYLQQAEKLYAKEAARQSNPREPRWGRSTCLGFIGRVYTGKKEYQKARIYYRKALDVNPADRMALMGMRELDEQTP